MLAMLYYVPSQLLLALSAISRWCHRHPRWASFLFITTIIYTTGFAVGSAAYAAPLGTARPDIPGDNLADQQGVRASHYANLFISYGSPLNLPQMWTAQALNLYWSSVYNGIVNAIDLFRWVIDFGWIKMIATPAEGIAIIVSRFLNQFQLTTFALFLCGLVAGLYIMRNKWPAAFVEIGMTIALSVLAAGLFANPIQWITSTNGPLDHAQQFGGQVSAALSGSGYLQGEQTKTDVIDDTITAPLVQVFVSDSVQVISFGHILTGKCEATFYKTVATATLDSSGRSSVHDAVAACDEDAGTYANNPSWLQLPEVIAVGGGTFGLLGAGLFFAILAMGAVVVLFWDGIRLMIATVAGMFPFSDRSKFWKSLFGVLASLVGIVFMTGMLVLYLSFLCQMITGLLKSGFSMVTMMNVVTTFIMIIFFLLIWQLISLRRRGHKISELIHNKLEQTKSISPTMALPGMTALASTKQLLPKRRPQLRNPSTGNPSEDKHVQMVNFFGSGSGPVTGDENIGNMTATTAPRAPRPPTNGAPGSPSVTALTSRATRTVGSSLRLGRAAAAGPQALALEAGKMATQKAVSRIVVDKKGHGTVQRGQSETDAAHTMRVATTDPGVTSKVPTRRISIGVDGVGQVVGSTRPTFVVPPTVGPPR